MTESHITTPPSPFVGSWVRRLAGEGLSGFALDVASGRGRHAVLMASAGFRVIALDIQMAALQDAAIAARQRGVHVMLLCADLTRQPLPESAFRLIVCSRYLDRARFPALRAALAPGGVLLYETFTVQQRQHGRGPQSPDHLLQPGELRELAEGLEVLFFEEVTAPDAVARIAARRPR
jgi:protein-L-isoaspartate O-methyltransferase